jgi:hypothetical protein
VLTAVVMLQPLLLFDGPMELPISPEHANNWVKSIIKDLAEAAVRVWCARGENPVSAKLVSYLAYV